MPMPPKLWGARWAPFALACTVPTRCWCGSCSTRPLVWRGFPVMPRGVCHEMPRVHAGCGGVHTFAAVTDENRRSADLGACMRVRELRAVLDIRTRLKLGDRGSARHDRRA